MRAIRVAVTLLAIPWLALACADPADIEIPDVDTSTMEWQVAERLRMTREAVIAEPRSARAWADLAMDFHAHTLYGQAADSYLRAADLAPDDYRWPYLAGICTSRSDRVEALRLYERAAALAPRSAPFGVIYGDALAEAGEEQRAAAEYRAALEVDPTMGQALQGLGRLALQAGRLDEARANLERAANLAPHHGEVHKLLAQVYQRSGATERAELAALAAHAYPEDTGVPDPLFAEIDLHAVSSRAHSQRGLRLARERRFVEAESAFRQVLTFRSRLARDHANLGAALAGQGRLDEAIESYLNALEIDSEDAYAHNNLALALMEQGNLAEADDHLRSSLEIDPLYSDALFNLGLLREKQERSGEALRAYGRALEANPANGRATNNLARLHASRGDELRAAELLQRAVAIDPLNLDASFNLSLLLTRLGQHGPCIRVLEGALRHAPNSSLLSQSLAWELATAPQDRLRDGARAVELASRVYSQYPDRPGSADVLGAALAEVGDFGRAVEMAEKAVEAAMSMKQGDLVKQAHRRLELYRAGRPFRQPAGAGT